MTFLAIAHARGCILALSDRKESVSQSCSNEVTKYCLCDAGDVYMALAGNAETAENLLSEIRLRRPSGAGVFRDIDRVAAELFAKQIREEVAGHLIVADGAEFKAYAISIVSGILAYDQIADPTHAEGDAGAVALCKRLALDMPLSDMPCETAARCLHTMASYMRHGHNVFGLLQIRFRQNETRISK